TVLTRNNVHKIDQLYRFYQRAGMSFRLLPLFDGAYDDQHERFDLSTLEMVSAFKRLTDLWLAAKEPLQVNPIVEYVHTVLLDLSADQPRRYYRRRDWVVTFLINTNGDCYAYGDPYGQPEWSLGNIFDMPLQAILSGKVFDASTLECEKRIAANCL